MPHLAKILHATDCHKEISLAPSTIQLKHCVLHGKVCIVYSVLESGQGPGLVVHLVQSQALPAEGKCFLVLPPEASLVLRLICV